MSEEQIGFHKGSIQTLIAEKSELMKMISNVDNIMLAHNEALKKLGVQDYLEELRKMQEQAMQEAQKNQEINYQELNRSG